MSPVSSLPTHARSESPSLPREFTPTMAFSEVASAYQLSLLTTVALIIVAFDVVGNEWTFSLYPLLIREVLKQPLVARRRQWTHTPLTRKPYTIMKQRERWTEEEHNRFLEALKLYGRAWQRIEEHIGTKTAVQIRSHAQKFFSKLEKEAVIKGVPIGQALEIDIPPPRPKRRPTNPYPRKTSIGAPTSQKPIGDEKRKSAKDDQDDSCSEVFTLLQEAHHSSVSSPSKSSKPTPAPVRNSCTLTEFIPSIKGSITQDEANESYVTSEHKGNQKSEKADAKLTIQGTCTSKGSKSENSNVPHEKSVQGEKTDDLNCAMPMDEKLATQNYPRHVPVHVVDGRVGTCTQTPSSDMSFQNSIFHPMGEVHGHPNLFTNPAASATAQHQTSFPRSSADQSFPAFPPPTSTFHNQDDYQSFHISSTFSRLIVSALYQNPAAHAAASFAATFWPHANVENSADSPAGIGGSFLRQMGSTPSMAAIAAATVAAATAWWAAHGLLPICAPLHAPYTCTPASTLAVPPIDGQAPAAKTDREESTLHNHPLQQLEQDYSEIGQVQHSASKSPTLSSSDSEESGGAKLNTGSKAADQQKAISATELHDSNKAKGRKLVDRSSCGSNTTSSSEVETDALEKHEKAKLETHEKGKEEPEEPDANHLASESGNRRSRSACNMSDSWKEVSEGGRLAFQALFSRGVLPQSFVPPNDVKNKGHQKDTIQQEKQNADEKDGNASLLDLISETCGSCSSDQGGNNNGEDGLLTIGLGHGKLKARRTVFKPYKRCLVEANENKVINASIQGEEKGPKRIRLEGAART